MIGPATGAAILGNILGPVFDLIRKGISAHDMIQFDNHMARIENVLDTALDTAVKAAVASKLQEDLESRASDPVRAHQVNMIPQRLARIRLEAERDQLQKTLHPRSLSKIQSDIEEAKRNLANLESYAKELGDRPTVR